MKMTSKDVAPSTDGAANLVPVDQNEVMAIEPVAGAQLAAPVAGQFNAIDPWIRLNFVQAPNGEFSVSPRNSTGEILLDLELGPELNPFLAHLARMYNAYAGGMEVQVILAGNAFAAGKIIFAAIPPGFPAGAISASQATNFPHVIVDVRQLEPVNLPLPDVRNRLFHFNNEAPEPRMRLVAILYTPLRVGNTGDDVFTVSCRVLTRPSQDFEFMFLVPPTVEQKTTPFSLPDLEVGQMTNSRFPLRIDVMAASPNAQTVIQFQNGRCTIDGTLLGTTLANGAAVCEFNGAYIGSNARAAGEDATDEPDTIEPRSGWSNAFFSLAELDGQAFEPGVGQLAPLGTPDFVATIKGTISRLTPNREQVIAEQNTEEAANAPGLGTARVQYQTNSITLANNQVVTFRPYGLHGAGRYNQFVLPPYSPGNPSGLAPAVAPDFPSEKVLFFRSDMPCSNHTPSNNWYIDCLLPNEYVSHFYSLAAPRRGDLALVRYINPESNRVLFEAKLHPEGFFTISGANEGPLVFPTNGYFRFDSWVSRFYTLSPVGSGSGRSGRTKAH
uniref:VP1 capsid protein n=1 Tax=California sea lion norovirus TaxID=2070151 RepID=A0A2R2ZG46_9CALI|nr:VP1 capsid protein [California sea lion norovirus]